jgi:hypothetical protein
MAGAASFWARARCAIALILAPFFFSACKPAPAPPAPAAPVPTEIWREFSGENAMNHARALDALGPRPAGSEALEKARAQLIAVLEKSGWKVARQNFTEQTPRGPVQFTNLIARFRDTSATTPEAILCTHYDTKIFDTIRFTGASDGTSGTAALIEAARVLALDPAFAKKIELVFFDGEEAVQQFTETDGLYGSRFYARQIRAEGRAQQYRLGILWDMIGDRDLTITLPPDSPADLARAVFAAASTLGCRESFGYHASSILDDHVPLNQLRIPTIDLIDFDYRYWHTADDTLDKISAESLQKVAAVTLRVLHEKLTAR